MKRNLFLLIFVGMMLFSLVSAEEEIGKSWGAFEQGEEVRIVQTCSDATYINISSISYPNSQTAATNINMNYLGNGEFYYVFNSTEQLGRYDVRGISDGCQETFTQYFVITPSGFANTLGFYILMLIIMGSVIFIGFYLQDAWFVILGGMGLIMLGIYSINYGVAGFKDMFMTWGIGLFEIAVGAILSIQGGIQKMYYD